MSMSDPIADMLTRIRNANNEKHKFVNIPLSNIKASIADILIKEGYISSYEIIGDEVKKNIRIQLKYSPKKEKVITDLKRISKPGLRVYVGNDEIPRVRGGLGVAIISTNKGIVTDKEARAFGVGGEVLAFIW